MKDRIKQLMDSQHMTQQNFADFIGVSSASLSNIFNGRQKPTLNTVEAIRTKFSKLSLDWLMYGQGPMFKDQSLMNKEQDPNLQKNEGAAATEGQLDFGSSATTPSYHQQATQAAYNLSDHASIPSNIPIKIIDKPQRKITEIRVFYDDQTWETFVPKKS